ncbi:MAG: hypothetical protein II103_08235, partial [Treponema sp.]|nr:hypothetical protein [Treponema sp.]
RHILAKWLACFRRKHGSKKWQGGHFLRALRGSGIRLHCWLAASNPPLAGTSNPCRELLF